MNSMPVETTRTANVAVGIICVMKLGASYVGMAIEMLKLVVSYRRPLVFVPSNTHPA